MTIIENAIQSGHPILLQDIMEEIDPSLEPILVKAFVVRSGKVCYFPINVFIKKWINSILCKILIQIC